MLSGVWYENKDRPRIEPLRRSDFFSPFSALPLLSVRQILLHPGPLIAIVAIGNRGCGTKARRNTLCIIYIYQYPSSRCWPTWILHQIRSWSIDTMRSVFRFCVPRLNAHLFVRRENWPILRNSARNHRNLWRLFIWQNHRSMNM